MHSADADGDGDFDSESFIFNQKKAFLKKGGSSETRNLIIQAILFLVIFMALSLLDYFLSSTAYIDLRRLSDLQQSIYKLESHSNYLFAGLLYSTLDFDGAEKAWRRGEPETGAEQGLPGLVEFHSDALIDLKKDVLAGLGGDYPAEFKDYLELVRAFFFTSLCKNFFEVHRSGKMLFFMVLTHSV